MVMLQSKYRSILSSLSDDDLEEISSRLNCKDHQKLLRNVSADEEQYRLALLNRYGSMRSVFNKLCHLESNCPHPLSRIPRPVPELDYVTRRHSAPSIEVTFNFRHPINDGNCQNGGTYTAADPDSNPYDNVEDALAATWATDVDTWNEFQQRIKKMSREEIDELVTNWSEKIQDGSWLIDF